MTDEYADFRDDAPPSNVMDQVRAGVKLLLQYDAEVAAAEAALAAAKKRRNQVKFEDLPAVMKQLGGLSDLVIELGDGRKYRVKREEKVAASLSEGNSSYVLKWMEENGYAHHISSNVVIPFTKGQEEELEELETYLNAAPHKVQFKRDSSIHPSTYTAFCARLKKDGVVVEDSLFGIHVVNQVKLEPK